MSRKISSFFALLLSSKKAIFLIVILIVAVSTVATSSILLSDAHNLDVPTFGIIKTVGLESYWDPNLKNKTETIDWGIIRPGLSKNLTLYLRSVSTMKTTLNISTTNWNPENISNYMSLSWNYNGELVEPDEIISLTLTLSVSSYDNLIQYLVNNNVDEFSFNLQIVASE